MKHRHHWYYAEEVCWSKTNPIMAYLTSSVIRGYRFVCTCGKIKLVKNKEENK